jgi:hypothetical protein
MNRIIEELIISDELIHQVFAVGLVDKPAIDINWMKFSKEESIHKFSIDKAKRIITGPLAIPNLEIFRKDPEPDGKWVYFSEETIAKLAENFLKFSHQGTTTHNHAFNLAGNTVIESWLVLDPENDKSNKLGYRNLPKGTWMISVKVQDESYWNDMIETGILKGFSLEGSFDAKTVQMAKQKKHIKISMKKLLEFLKNMKFSADTEIADENIELEAAMFQLSFDEDGRVIDVDTMFMASYVDDSTMLSEGEHMVKSLDLTADYILVIGMEGKVLSIVTPWGLETATSDNAPVETIPVDTTAQAKDFTSEITEMQLQLANLIKQNAELNSKVTIMSKQSKEKITVKSELDKSEKSVNEISLGSIIKNRKQK